ncbi:unnamed protein product, partial [marine sediment metagenome]
MENKTNKITSTTEVKRGKADEQKTICPRCGKDINNPNSCREC